MNQKNNGCCYNGLGLPRDTFAVSSKVFWGGKKNVNGVKCKQVCDACAAALICLKVDYLDLYFCHRPSIDTPIEETLRAMYNLIVQGKVVYWGTSEWSAQQITEAHAYASAHHLTPPTMEQPQYNLLHRDKVDSEFLTLYKTMAWTLLFGHP